MVGGFIGRTGYKPASCYWRWEGRASPPPEIFYPRLQAFRFLLSFTMVGFHIFPGAFPQSGLAAVTLFFFISGFLITRLLRTIYRGRPSAFLTNRFLRIYPTYWMGLALATAVVVASPVIAKSTSSSLELPLTAPDIISNLLIFGLSSTDIRLVLSAWSH